MSLLQWGLDCIFYEFPTVNTIKPGTTIECNGVVIDGLSVKDYDGVAWDYGINFSGSEQLTQIQVVVPTDYK